MRMFRRRFLKITEALLKRGAEKDAKNGDGVTLLQIAMDRGDFELGGLLLRHDADVNLPDSYGRSPLHRTAKAQNVLMTHFLLGWGADPTIRDSDNKTPLDLIKGTNMVLEGELFEKLPLEEKERYLSTAVSQIVPR